MSSGHQSVAGRRVLLAEDEGSLSQAIRDGLTDAGYEVVASPDTGAGAVEAALTLRPDLILMDVGLKGSIDGIRASELINEWVDISVSEVSRLGLSPTATDHLYRIAQEALTNALKHANANSIRVTLDVERDRVRLEICDDGEGVKDAGPHTPGLGLRTMQYRASMIGARFEIAPFGRNGTRVRCDCPQESSY